jgi:GT2 family glycosyltransferase
MLRHVLQRLVRFAPGTARRAWSFVPRQVQSRLGPLVHPIAAGRRGGGRILEVPAPERRAPLPVVDARKWAEGASDADLQSVRIALGGSSADSLVARGILEACVLCDPGDERGAAFARLGWRRMEVPAGAVDPALESVFPKASIVIVTWDQPRLLRSCLASIARNTAWPSLEVVVVDNGSEPPAACPERPAWRLPIRLLRNEDNAGFARGSNQGLAAATGDIVVLLNDDTVVGPGWLARLVAHLEADPRLGLVCPVTNEIGSDARIETAYETIEQMEALARERAVSHAGRLRDTGIVPLFCAAARRDVLTEVGGLDERYAVGMFEDDDLCRTLRAKGYRLGVAEDAFVHHVGQASFSRLSDQQYLAIWEANQRRYEEKWGERWRPPEAPRRG